jgi:primosomal protein N' (replication factor Y)
VVGTQALFGRQPLPLVRVVGILHADSGLHLPDFRAAERTYQLLVDAEEVARPSSAGGRVIVQTLLPTHHAIESVVSGQPGRFYAEEVEARRLLGYPPARHLVSLSVSGLQAGLVKTAAQEWTRCVRQSGAGPESIMLLGPVPSISGRPAGHHRYHILAKGLDRRALLEAVRQSVLTMEGQYKRGQLKFVIDVDPLDMT